MKIGYFSSKFPYSSSSPDYICGGSVFATESLINEISKRGYDIKIFTSSKNSKSEFEKHENIDIHRYGTNVNLLSSNISIGLFREPLRYDVDIVHTSFDIPPGPFAGLRYAKKKNKPLIITYHGDWDSSYGSFIRRAGVTINNYVFVNRLLSYADAIISPSKLYIESSKYLDKYSSKIHIIPNGINLEEFQNNYSQEKAREILSLPQNKKIILFFGYLSPYKSPDILLKSFADILKIEKETVLVFAGSGDMENYLKKLSKKLKVESNVIFRGFIEKNYRSLYYKSADIFCLPSTKSTECYPLAILEAMASNLPVVASNIGGIPEVIKDEETGMLVIPNNKPHLTEIILKLLKNPEKREELSNNALDNIKKYSWENIANKTNELYENIGDLK